MKKIYLSLWIAVIIAAVIITLPCSFAQLIDVGRPPSQESYQLGINKASLGARYSEYYSMMGGSVPAYHVSFPVQFDITGNMPYDVYFSGQPQPVPFSSYQSGRRTTRATLCGYRERPAGRSTLQCLADQRSR